MGPYRRYFADMPKGQELGRPATRRHNAIEVGSQKLTSLYRAQLIFGEFMYTALMLTMGQVGCNGGSPQNYAPQFYYPPAVFSVPQYPQLPMFQNYSPGNFQYTNYAPSFSYGSYRSPAWSPPAYYQQGQFGIGLFGRPVIEIHRSFRNGSAPRLCPTCP
jgi:hypothetical protein